MTKKRRIQPIAVDEDTELEVATLPVPAFSAQPTDSTRIVDPPEEGRRVWVGLDEGYEFNYKKILQHKGVKPTCRAKDAPSTQVMPAMPGMPGPSTQVEAGKPGEQGNQMQKAMRRIERRVQREHMVAVTGNAEADSDEDMEEPDVEVADGDVAQLDEDGKEDNDKEDGEEEQEYEQSKGPKNQYDLNDDFIDDSEFIEAIQMRDERKLKHDGFFVNSGAVERIGDRVPVVAAARARNKKKRNLPADGEEAPAGEQAAKPAKAPSKGTKKASKMDATKAGASEDSAPPPKVPRTENTAAVASSPLPTKATAPALSLVEMALQAGAMAAAGTGQPDTDQAQPAGQAASIAASPAQNQGDAIQSPDAAPANGQILSDRPPMFGGAAPVMPSPTTTNGQPPTAAAGATPSPSTAAHTVPDASTGVQMEAHAATMRSLPLDAAEDMLLGLQDWSTTARFREVLEEMREEAARSTPPGVAGTKKKMPQGLTVCLEALVRPFYISADAAPNVNKAKRAMWSLMMPILTPWSAENTIKTKMQKVNTQVLGAYQLEKNKLEGIAQWTARVGLHQGLNATRTLAIVRTFVDATVACDAIPLTAPDAEHVWAAVADVWNNAGGPILNGDLVQTLYRRAMETPVADVATTELSQAAVAAAAAGTAMPADAN